MDRMDYQTTALRLPVDGRWLPDLLAAFRSLDCVPNNKKRCQEKMREQADVIISLDLGKVDELMSG